MARIPRELPVKPRLELPCDRCGRVLPVTLLTSWVQRVGLDAIRVRLELVCDACDSEKR